MADTPPKPLRLWPGVLAAALWCLVRYVVPIVDPELVFIAAIAGMVCALAIVIWWLFFSRAPWIERLGAIALMPIAIVAMRPFVDVSVRTGFQGMMLPAYAVPIMCLALVAAVTVSRRSSIVGRRAWIVAALLISCASLALVRTAGVRGGQSDLAWRWTKSPEEKLLAHPDVDVTPPTQSRLKPAASTAASNVTSPSPSTPTPSVVPSSPSPAPKAAEWPGFRGPNRDSVVHGVRINTDWTTSPPVQMWRRPIGPGWSSFAVSGDLLYTQEQRGEEEIVACYNIHTGAPVWTHRDRVRFWESNGGAGPRGTPTLHEGRVYAFGATGILNALDAGTGAVLWARDVAKDAEKTVPMWGFSSSPLIEGDLVVVAASGKLVAYDISTGKRRWVGPPHHASYSSPHHAVIDGMPQILLLTADGVSSVNAIGTPLWEHAWAEGSTIVQPALTEDGNVLVNAITSIGGLGIRRLAVARTSNSWTVSERWTSNGLKPYFNDFVVHKGHAFGFDGSILSCINLDDGQRKWKGGRYGSGQLVLLPDQDLLLVVSEEGELALVSATADKYTELARMPAIEGKTWNHPAVVRDVLLVRNGEEMAAFKLR